MQEKDGIKKLAIIELLVCMIWCIIVLVFANYDKADFYFWGGFSFALFSFLVAGISLLLIKKKNQRNTTEIRYIPVYYTAFYLLASILINTYFVCRLAGKHNIILVVLNALIFIVFISIRLFTDGYVSRVGNQTKYSTEKTMPSTTISSKLSTLLSIATESDIKKELLKLKETVDYSSNVSQRFSENSNNLFLLLLNQIESLMVEKQDKEEIIKKIQEATVVWKTRNGMASTIK